MSGRGGADGGARLHAVFRPDEPRRGPRTRARAPRKGARALPRAADGVHGRGRAHHAEGRAGRARAARRSWTCCPSGWCSRPTPRRPSAARCGRRSGCCASPWSSWTTPSFFPRERERIVTRIRSLLTGLWQTDLVRPRRPSVLEEVEVGLYFAATLWEVAPDIYAELDRALRKIYPRAAFRLPPFLGFGSWIGGDRDGNPYVSAQVTATDASAHARGRRGCAPGPVPAALRRAHHLRAAGRASPPSCARPWSSGRRSFPEILPLLEPLSPHETYRRFLKTVEWRLQRTRAMDSLERAARGGLRHGSRAGRGPGPDQRTACG